MSATIIRLQRTTISHYFELKITLYSVHDSNTGITLTQFQWTGGGGPMWIIMLQTGPDNIVITLVPSYPVELAHA